MPSGRRPDPHSNTMMLLQKVKDEGRCTVNRIRQLANELTDTKEQSHALISELLKRKLTTKTICITEEGIASLNKANGHNPIQ